MRNPFTRRGTPDRWTALTDLLLEGIKTCEPVYRPTNFWTPGLRDLLDDLERRGLETFKSWPTAGIWFYPRYGRGFTRRGIRQTFEHASAVNPALRRKWFAAALDGTHEAYRDYDAVRLAWDQTRWPLELPGPGESEVGEPPQRMELDGTLLTKPHLNYLLCMAALSRHVDTPPRSFLEIGGGFGVLGEIVGHHDPDARYVNADIPPLLTVASYYLSTLFGDAAVVTADRIAATGPIEVARFGCVPNWRIRDVRGPFDVFCNSFSFQEMEPPVVTHYAEAVADIGVQYVVSLNSRHGKRRATQGEEGGVLEPVTSDFIVERFEGHGYRLCGRYNDPLIRSAGELVVLRRR